MLLDDFVPQYDFHERHETVVPAPKEVVRRAVEEWRPGELFLWRFLFRLRGLGQTGQLAEAMGFSA